MQADVSSKTKKTVMLMAVGGILAAIGSFLNFATISVTGAGLDESTSVAGMDTDDGPIFIGCAIAVLVAAGVVYMGKSPKLRRGLAVLALLAALVLAGGAAVDISDIDSTASGAEEGFASGAGVTTADLEAAGIKVEASTGIGLYLALVGGIIALVGSGKALFTKGDEAVAVVPPPAAGPPDSAPPPA